MRSGEGSGGRGRTGSRDKIVELLVTTDGELKVARCDTLDLEVLGGVAGQLEDFGAQVLQDSCGVHGGGGTDAVVGLNAALQVAVDTADGKLRRSEW